MAMVMAASRLERPIASRWARLGPGARWVTAIVPAVVALIGGLALRAWLSARWEVPAEWVARHRATSAELQPGAATAELLLFDLSLLARWSGALLGASLVAAWWAQQGRAPLEIGTWRQRLIHTLVGIAAATAVLQLGRLLALATDLAELARFALLFWVLGVGAPSMAEAAHARWSRR
jgi:hypothetical protein